MSLGNHFSGVRDGYDSGKVKLRKSLETSVKMTGSGTQTLLGHPKSVNLTTGPRELGV